MSDVEQNITRYVFTVSGPNPIGEYTAWIGDYDLDIRVGTGKTKCEAIADLCDLIDSLSE